MTTKGSLPTGISVSKPVVLYGNILPHMPLPLQLTCVQLEDAIDEIVCGDGSELNAS